MQVVEAMVALFKLIAWAAAGCGMLLATIALMWAITWIINRLRRD